MGTEAENLEENTEVEDNSLGAALGAAWDKSVAEEEDNGESIESAAPAEEATAITDDDYVDSAPAPGAVEENTQSAAAVIEGDQPPVGLPPEAREVWKDTPPAMQAAITKREGEFAAGIQKYAENAQRAQQMDQAFAPYQQLFAMNGGAPKMMPGLLQVASALQMGSPQQKAQTVANIIKQFGVDVRQLDGAIVGDAPTPEMQQENQFGQLLDQKLAPIQNFMGQFQQSQQQQATQAQEEIATEVETFSRDPKNEFYSDVKLDMADLMDMANNRGQNMSLAEAYEKACKMHPQISQIMETRANQQLVNEKRTAASSIGGAPGGGGPTGEPSSVRAAIEEAWDNVGRV